MSVKQLAVGILAHVDAGKTTLSEALLYESGALRKWGRVDHGDSFLDTDPMERERGITIFAKQAIFRTGETEITLIDTPGHVDFSGETERTLSVLDYAILVVSGTEGLQAHTVTLWQLLARYHVPTLLFINKMDLPGPGRETLLAELRARFGDGCFDLSDARSESVREQVAMCDEALLDAYMTGTLTEDTLDAALCEAVRERRLFPCYFGSALQREGIQALLTGLDVYTCRRSYPATFGARVYKISRDGGTRLTHVKITGGELATRTRLATGADGGEKVDQIRLYSGTKYRTVDRAAAGQVCVLTGLEATYPGQGLGREMEAERPVLEPVLSYRILPPEGYPITEFRQALRQLEEEDPMLCVSFDETLGEIYVALMGEVQCEILRRQIADRFGLAVTLDDGRIVYKETITEAVEGIGHFEPLRHYAEVHLLLEPGEPGSGLSFDTLCSENVLARNWQHLVLTHLAEKCHVGVLTGSPLTDVKISLLTGRAHPKHTVGGDFRQATYRAVRQGLMQAHSVLLEPWYRFRLDVPQENSGRAMTDIGQMSGNFTPFTEGETTILEGIAPVSEMKNYAAQVNAYTKGRGHLFCRFDGYYPCHNEDEVVQAMGYEAERDVANTADSVFCSHGAGTVIPWQDVPQYMHVPSPLKPPPDEAAADASPDRPDRPGTALSYENAVALDRELTAIFERTYGPIRHREAPPEPKRREFGQEKPRRTPRDPVTLPEYVLVDGYNIIFAWDELKQVAEDNLNLARQMLIHLLCNYQGYRRCGLILVFDAYKVAGGKGSVEKQGGIHVVYTREAETADAYIERVTYELGKKYRVRVATSDALEQMIVLGHGAIRVPARLFHEEVCRTQAEIREEMEKLNRGL